MRSINIYKISEENKKIFLSEARQSYRIIGQKTVIVGPENVKCKFTLCEKKPKGRKLCSWNWAIKEVGGSPIYAYSQPSGLLMAEVGKEDLFVISFGASFYDINEYCDNDFGFDFASRFRYSLKMLASTAPNRNKNKTISSYINNTQLDFESGEAILKIKGEIKNFELSEIMSPKIEVGTSIKAKISEEKVMDNIARTLLYMQKTLLESEIKTKFPRLTLLSGKDSQKCKERLIENIDGKNLKITIELPDFDIIGTSEIFSGNFPEIFIGEGKKKQLIEDLNWESIKEWAINNNVSTKRILDSRIELFDDAGYSIKKQLYKIITFHDEDGKMILIRGKWYKYDDNFLEFLNEKMDDIVVEPYEAQKDYSQDIENVMMKKANVNEKERDYREKLYNRYMADNFGYKLGDIKSVEETKMGKYEKYDLRTNDTLCTVKFGSGSSALDYAFDQSLASARILKSGNMDKVNRKEIKRICVWLVLDRKNKIEDKNNGLPQLKKLKMLYLKMKIIEWDREIRNMGFEPVIKINYENSKETKK